MDLISEVRTRGTRAMGGGWSLETLTSDESNITQLAAHCISLIVTNVVGHVSVSPAAADD